MRVGIEDGLAWISRSVSWWSLGVVVVEWGLSALLPLLTRVSSNRTWRDPSLLYLPLGLLLNACFARGLKGLIGQARPSNEWESDPGMPSTHASMAGFLFTHLCLRLFFSDEGPMREGNRIFGVLVERIPKSLRLLAFSVSLIAGAYTIEYRIRTRRHTTAQILVGCVLGTVVGWIWTHCMRRGLTK